MNYLDEEWTNIFHEYGKLIGFYFDHPVGLLSQLPASRDVLEKFMFENVHNVKDETQRKSMELCFTQLAKFIPDEEFDIFLEKEKLEKELKTMRETANLEKPEERNKYEMLTSAYTELKARTDLITFRIKIALARRYQEIRFLLGNICSVN